MKVNLNTDEFLKDGKQIQLGDVLEGSSTQKMEVIWSAYREEFLVRVIAYPNIWFTLEEFLDAWSDIKIVGKTVDGKLSFFE